MREWDASLAAAKARLTEILPRMGADYARLRNFDLGPDRRDHISCLSPWIRHGLLDEQTVLAGVLQTHDARSADSFIREVFWRGYFKGWLEHRPEVWQDYRASLARMLDRVENRGGIGTAYRQAIEARTGIEAFDAWAEELVETGYLHNHARMWFASIWIFTLRLPWELGADFFLRHLLDGDPASNTCSWRWVAGLHTRGKHYLARAENIRRFTEGRFDPAGQLDETAEPIDDGSDNPDPELPDIAWRELPQGPAGLLLTPDSLTDDTLSKHEHTAVLGIHLPGGRSPRPASAAVKAFEARALMQRLAAHPGGPGSFASCRTADEAALSVEGWARRAQLRQVILPWTTVGPYRDVLPRIEAALRSAGIQLHVVSRRYDRLVWPHAAKGFFKLKSRIPALLGDLDLG